MRRGTHQGARNVRCDTMRFEFDGSGTCIKPHAPEAGHPPSNTPDRIRAILPLEQAACAALQGVPRVPDPHDAAPTPAERANPPRRS